MSDISGIVRAAGLTSAESAELEALLDVYDRTRARNRRLERYFEGDVMVDDIGVKILPPDANVDVDLSCDWAKKSVKAMSSLVRFDGFVFDGDGQDDGLVRALGSCNFKAGFARNRLGMFKKGCMFATVNNVGTSANIRFHSADSGAAIIDLANERLRSGFVIADAQRTRWSPRKAVPVQVNLHMAGVRVAIRRVSATEWRAEHVETPLDRPMMVAFAYNPTDTKPLGCSRITKQVRDLVDDVLRLRLALVVSTAFYAVPMRALLGLSDAAYDALSNSPKWTQYINPMLLATAGKTGNVPTLQQLPSNSPEALIRLIESDAKLFAGSTGVPLNSLGIVQDNPSSAEAIAEGRKDLTDDAEDLIDQMAPAMRDLALMCMCVESNTGMDGLDDFQLSVMPKFANPAMPSLSARTDAAMKIASVDEGFAGTDVFYEMVGMDRATIARLRSEKRRSAAQGAIDALAGIDVAAAEDDGLFDGDGEV